MTVNWYWLCKINIFVFLMNVQYIPRNKHTVFALLCFVVVIHWLIVPYPSGLLHWHCGNLTIASVPAKQPWWIWINTSCEFIMSDYITTTKQSTTKPCAYFLGYTVSSYWTVPMYLHHLYVGNSYKIYFEIFPQNSWSRLGWIVNTVWLHTVMHWKIPSRSIRS